MKIPLYRDAQMLLRYIYAASPQVITGEVEGAP
jgi:hypothetical protein